MAIKPYASRVSVQPVSSINTAGIVKAGQIGARSMLGTARVLNTLGEIAYKKGAEVATKEGFENASGLEIEREDIINEDGKRESRIVVPSNLPEEDTFYNNSYRKTVMTKYTNELQSDISKTLGDMQRANRFDPDNFYKESTEYLQQTYESVPASARVGVEIYGTERQRQLYASTANAHTRRLDVQTQQATEFIIKQNKTDITSMVLQGSSDSEGLNKAKGAYEKNLRNLIPYLGEDVVEGRIEAFNNKIESTHFFVQYTMMDENQRANIKVQLRENFSSKEAVKKSGVDIYKQFPLLAKLQPKEKDGLDRMMVSYDQAVKQAYILDQKEMKDTLVRLLARQIMGNTSSEEKTGFSNLIKTLPEDFISELKKKNPTAYINLLSKFLTQDRSASERRTVEVKEKLIQNKKLRSEQKHELANQILFQTMSLYSNEIYQNQMNLSDFVMNEIKVINSQTPDSKMSHAEEGELLRYHLQQAEKTSNNAVNTKILGSLSSKKKMLSRALGLSTAGAFTEKGLTADGFPSPNPTHAIRLLKTEIQTMEKIYAKQVKESQMLQPHRIAAQLGTSVRPDKKNGNLVIKALIDNGATEEQVGDINFLIANANFGIPQNLINTIEAGLNTGNNEEQIASSVRLFSSYFNLGVTGQNHLRAQLGSEKYLKMFQIRSISGGEDAFSKKATMEAVRLIQQSKGNDFALGSFAVNLEEARNPKTQEVTQHKFDLVFEKIFNRIGGPYLEGEFENPILFGLSNLTSQGVLFDSNLGSGPPDKVKRKITFSSIPQKLKTSIKNKFLVNLQMMNITGEADNDQMEQALKSAIADNINSDDLGNYAWSRFAPTTTEYAKGDLVLTANAVESHFSVLNPNIEGKDSNWIGPQAMKLLENQLSKNDIKNKGTYVWGKNVYLQDSGKVNDSTGKPIYNVRVRKDKVFGNMLYNNEGRKIEIDLSPAFHKQEAIGITEVIAEQLAEKERLANRSDAMKEYVKRVKQNLKERDTSREPRDKTTVRVLPPTTGVN